MTSFSPIVLAVLLDFLLSPLIRAFKRVRVPEALSAALVVLVFLGSGGGRRYGLASPAKEWMAKLPASMRTAQARLAKLRKPVEQVSKTAEQVEKATSVDQGEATQVVVKGPGLGERLFGTTQSILTGALEVIILLYFLLAAGDMFLQKLIKVLPLLRDKKKAVAIVRETEASISTYLFTVTLVNLGSDWRGAVVISSGCLIPALGRPGRLAEFVPYLGASVMLIVLSLAGFVTFRPGLVTHCWCLAHIWPSTWFRRNFVTPPSSGAASRSILWPSSGAGVLVVALGCGRRLHRCADPGDLQDLLRPYRSAGADRGVSG